jgi:hypothetical protein
MSTCSEKCPYETICDGTHCDYPEFSIEVKSLNSKEPSPIQNNKPSVWDLVLYDIKERDNIGKNKYGTRLQPFNGRDVLKDAYQEALDLVVYLRQAIYERDNQGGFW